MIVPESPIATKHIELSLRAKRIAKGVYPQFEVLIATYTAGRSGQTYQSVEEMSGEEFWSLKVWSPQKPHRRLKDPDLVIVDSTQVKCLLEIKWGAVQGHSSTDILIKPQERDRMAHLMQEPALCRVSGPAVQDRQRFASSEFGNVRDFTIDKETRFVLVADFRAVKRILPQKYERFVEMGKEAAGGYYTADISDRVDAIPSLRQVLESVQ